MPEIERLAGKQFFGAHAFHMRTALGGTFIRDKKNKQKKTGILMLDVNVRDMRTLADGCECQSFANGDQSSLCMMVRERM